MKKEHLQGRYYAFVESFEDIDSAPSALLTPELRKSLEGKAVNQEVVLSLINQDYFDSIEREFGRCNSKNAAHRRKRKQDIRHYFRDQEGRTIFVCYIWFDQRNTGNEVGFRRSSQSRWYGAELTIDSGFPVYCTPDDGSDEWEIVRLNQTFDIDDYMKKRLSEVFSLEHVPWLDDEGEGGEGLTGSMSGGPGSPATELMNRYSGNWGGTQHEKSNMKRRSGRRGVVKVRIS